MHPKMYGLVRGRLSVDDLHSPALIGGSDHPQAAARIAKPAARHVNDSPYSDRTVCISAGNARSSENDFTALRTRRIGNEIVAIDANPRAAP